MTDPDDTFFGALKAETEAQWDRNSPSGDGRIGTFASQGMRWKPALTSEEISAVEERFGLRFPSAYRAMLRVMGGTTPMQRLGYLDASGQPTSEPVMTKVTGFYDPRDDVETIAALRDSLAERLWGPDADAEGSGHPWPRTFGPRPESYEAALSCIRSWLREAPPLWPLYLHRYLVIEKDPAKSVVLSVWHNCDIVVYGGDLRDYLCHELGVMADATSPRDATDVRVPAWSDLIEPPHALSPSRA
ncbi:MAG: SMI1/KNR4 family protein [Deltaproteobacteria bacterium]|nr:SMI1/KNR4 family protein [Deltaproteobacteria bacterium]